MELSLRCQLRLSGCFLALNKSETAYKIARAVIGLMKSAEPSCRRASSSTSPSSPSLSASEQQQEQEQQQHQEENQQQYPPQQGAFSMSEALPQWLRRHWPEALYRLGTAARALGRRAVASRTLEQALGLVEDAQRQRAAVLSICPSSPSAAVAVLEWSEWTLARGTARRLRGILRPTTKHAVDDDDDDDDKEEEGQRRVGLL